MMQPVHAVPSSSSPALHFADLVRAAAPLLGAGALLKFTAFNDHLLPSPIAWIVIVAFVVAMIAAAARILLGDALGPRDSSQRAERTRRVNFFQEAIIAGSGSLMLAVPALILALSTSQEVWAGQVEDPKFSAIGLACALFVGALGLPMVFYRPQFILDPRAGKITRYALGRSVPLFVKELPYAGLTVYSESLVTNTGARAGEMIRGRVSGYTFEIERFYAAAPDVVLARAQQHAASLGATYLTPDQAAAAELQ